MRTTQKSRVFGPPLDGFATIPDLPPEAATVPFVRVELDEAIDAPVPRARGSTPLPPVERFALPSTTPVMRPSERLARPSTPPPVERLARPSTPPPRASSPAPYDSGPRPEPRYSTAPSVSRVAPSRPRPVDSRSGPYLRPTAPRQIAWGRVIVAIATASALLGAGIAKLLYRATAPVAAVPAPATNLVAVMPFENRSADPALGRAPLALAKVLADELAARVVLELAVLDPGGAPDPARGLAASRARGAAAIVRGSLADHPGGGIQVRVEVVRRGGKPVTVLERRATAVEVADAVRAGVPAFAGILVDPREVPRHLAFGRTALVEDRVADAHRRFDTVLLHDPNHAGAIYERALVSPSSAALDEALAAPLAPAEREVLAAYRQLADARFPAAISSFTTLAAARPGDFHVLRGLFEAQLRGGRGADAIRTFGRLRALEPRTRVGMLDVLAYAIAHPGAPDLAWAGAALDQAPARSLRARRLVADRDYRGAAALLAGVDAGLAARDPDLTLVRLHLDLATGRLGDLDDAVAALEPRRPASHLAYRLALAHARGDAGALARWLAPAALDAIDRADVSEIAELVPLAIALGHAELRDRVVRGLDRQPGSTQRAVSHQLARALLGDTAPSPYPEVDAVAQAVAAERAGDWKAAAAAWRAAVPLSLDGRTLAVEQLGIARALHRAGDLDGAAAACRDVLEPRSLQPHWGIAAGDCYAWSVEAALDRRDRATALELVERLAALRSPGGALDPVLRRVRALLVQ